MRFQIIASVGVLVVLVFEQIPMRDVGSDKATQLVKPLAVRPAERFRQLEFDRAFVVGMTCQTRILGTDASCSASIAIRMQYIAKHAQFVFRFKVTSTDRTYTLSHTSLARIPWLTYA